ncbi:MAG: hypothetical protein J0I19_13565 [Alphaproteobacteria bacterium]|nr:hypothetical protein [Alphaproteobacteria bacterium]
MTGFDGTILSTAQAQKRALYVPDVSPDGIIGGANLGGGGGACLRRRTISPSRPGGSRIAINAAALASSGLRGSGFMARTE